VWHSSSPFFQDGFEPTGRDTGARQKSRDLLRLPCRILLHVASKPKSMAAPNEMSSNSQKAVVGQFEETF
jgi:hypothetical protein